MDNITHRELRNSSGEVLRRVEAGERLVITNNGRPAAVLGPITRDTLDELIASGGARPASAGVDALARLRPQSAGLSTREIIDDIRRS